MLDLLQRILRLTDLLTNSRNFGFVCQKNDEFKIKVIDFNMVQEYTNLINNEHFSGFLVGNGRYNYGDSTMIKTL